MGVADPYTSDDHGFVSLMISLLGSGLLLELQRHNLFLAAVVGFVTSISSMGFVFCVFHTRKCCGPHFGHPTLLFLF